MSTLVVATRNRGKLVEIQAMLPQFNLLTLDDIGFEDEIPEPYFTFRKNAFAKASAIYNFCGKPVMADDSGLCVEALGGKPGVNSAIYAGEPRSDQRNNEKLLSEMKGVENRNAYFESMICYVHEAGVHYFEGRCAGMLSTESRGSKGFGYDSVFIPKGFIQTLGELAPDVKRRISHRAKAVSALVAFLQRSPSS